ncbi:MAG: hypothetical protein SFX18_18690 [Pirellulales bacterium]|nr:hypothetical protein [Pirellulales bacterium]
MSNILSHLRKILFIVTLCVGGWSYGAGHLWAARAESTKLLPKETLVYVRVANVPEFVSRFRETGFARMLADPQMRPLVEQLYGKARDAVEEVKDQTALGLDEMLQIPAGEIAFAVIARAEGQPVPVLIIDTGDNVANAKKLMDKIRENNPEPDRREEQIEGYTVIVDEVATVERDGTFVFTTEVGVLGEILRQWEGIAEQNLQNNPKYGAIMRSCRAKDQDPQFTWFVDPIGLFKEFSKASFSASAALAFLPALGLDGLQAIGGSLAFSVDEFDTLAHIHLQLDNPRAGVLEALALTEGDMKPQTWVPGNVSAYNTIYFDVPAAFHSIEKLVDSFQGEGRVAEEIQRNVSDNIGVDVIKEILPLFKGRGTWITRRPSIPREVGGVGAEVTNQQAEVNIRFGRDMDQLIAIEVTDLAQAQKLFDQVVAKFHTELGERMEKKSWSGMAYYQFTVPNQTFEPVDEEDSVRPQPCVAFAHDCVIVSNYPGLMKTVLGRQDASDTLAESLDYKLMSSKLLRQVGDAKVGALTFDRPEESLRYLWEIAEQQQTRERLKQVGENNRFFRTLDEVMEQNPLPPFSVVEKYFAPSGGVLTNDDSGFHYIAFSLKRKTE